MDVKRFVAALIGAAMLTSAAACSDTVMRTQSGDDEKYCEVVFECDQSAGTLVGETVQRVKVGTPAAPVRAKSKKGFVFDCWSDGSYDEVVTVVPNKEGDLTVTADFVALPHSLPVVTVETDGMEEIVSKENYVGCSVAVSGSIDRFDFAAKKAKIRGRGNSTWGMPKKPYKLKFDKKVDLFGNGEAKTWTLIANYCDQSLMRNQLAFAVASALDDLKFTTSFQPVELYLNGSYDGVYLVCEQVEVGTGRVEIKEEDEYLDLDTGYFVELDARVATEDGKREGIDYFNGPGGPYEVKSPDTEDPRYGGDYTRYIGRYIDEAFSAIKSGYTSAEKFVDFGTFADAYIVHELFNCCDVGFSSFNLYKDKGGKLCAGPVWDFDISSGNCDYNDSASPFCLWAATQNQWYKELLKIDAFRELVADKISRYKPIISQIIADEINYAYSLGEYYEKNFDRWKILGVYVWPNTEKMVGLATWRQHVEYLDDWLAESLGYMCRHYGV